jgi:polyisoprenoid-binding protein YceI
MKKLVPLTAACTLAMTGFAALAASPYTNTYTIDPVHTIPTFEIGHLGLSHYIGRFDKLSGSVTLDMEKKTGSVDVTIDATSISTDVQKLNEHLSSPDYFDVAKYPTITYKSNSLKFKGDKVVAITGDLTMHGVTRPVTFKVDAFVCTPSHFFRKVPACGAAASTVIKRTDFGIVGPYAPPVLGDDVTLRVQIEAFKS